jgi:hypothetical protein
MDTYPFYGKMFSREESGGLLPRADHSYLKRINDYVLLQPLHEISRKNDSHEVLTGTNPSFLAIPTGAISTEADAYNRL